MIFEVLLVSWYADLGGVSMIIRVYTLRGVSMIIRVYTLRSVSMIIRVDFGKHFVSVWFIGMNGYMFIC